MRHKPVCQNQIGLQLLKKRHRLPRVRGAAQILKPTVQEDAFEQPHLNFLIVNNQNLRPEQSIVSERKKFVI
jgi:hypothetical protein